MTKVQVCHAAEHVRRGGRKAAAAAAAAAALDRRKCAIDPLGPTARGITRSSRGRRRSKPIELFKKDQQSPVLREKPAAYGALLRGRGQPIGIQL